jgi:hypothetical protein
MVTGRTAIANLFAGAKPDERANEVGHQPKPKTRGQQVEQYALR